MIRGIYTSSSAMQLLENKVEVIANNIANVDTAGFKKRGVFQQQLVGAEEALWRNQLMEETGGAKKFHAKYADQPELYNEPENWNKPLIIDTHITKRQINVPTPWGASPTYSDFSDGSLQQTGNPLDLGITGDGFFAVQTANGLGYTRAGQFSLTPEGRLVDQEGRAIMGESGPIEINGTTVDIGEDGTISVDGQVVNRFSVSNFTSLANIPMEGNLYKPEQALVEPSGNYKVMQGYIEHSNVNIVQEMVELITAQRNYEANQKAVKTQDDALSKTVDQVGK